MSHFLRRIAAAARKPGGTVHPLLGSVYSRSVPEPVPLEDALVDARAEASHPARGNDAAHEEEILGNDARSARSAPRVNEDSDAEIPPARRTVRTGHAPAPVAQTHAVPRLESTSASASASALFEEPGATGSFETLMPPQPGARALEVPGARSPAPPHDGNARTANTASRRSHSPDRPMTDAPSIKPPEPRQPLTTRPSRRAGEENGGRQDADDIQIHIGRIEVTAAPPPVRPQTPAAPRRPTPSLDEYLKRRGARR